MIKDFRIKTDNRGRGYKYNRTYVKKNQANFIPFSKGSYVSKWDDDYWHGNKKVDNYIIRFLMKNVGKNLDEVFNKFSKLGFRNLKETYSKWDEYIEQEHSYAWDLERWGRIIGFYADENNILCHNKWNKHDYKEYVHFTSEQLDWNDTREIPIFGKVREEPNGDLIGTAKRVRYINDFYVIYKGEILLLPVYHVPYGEIESWGVHKVGTLQYQHNQRYNNTFKRVHIPLRKGYKFVSSNWYDYYSGQERVVNDDGKYEYIKKDVIGNLGYGDLHFHIIIAQAEKEYEKVMFKKRISEF